MNSLKSEFHCHNIFSNGNIGDLEPIYDCNVTIPNQLEQAYMMDLDVLFVTNHNTIDGFKQMTEYKKNHKKFACIRIYPAEEVTTDNESHVLVYGIDHAIKPGVSLYEILDEVKKHIELTKRSKEYLRFLFDLQIKDLKNFTNLISQLKQENLKFEIIRHKKKKYAFIQRVLKNFKRN